MEVGRRVTTEQLIKRSKDKKKVKSETKKENGNLDLIYIVLTFSKKWRQKTRQGKKNNNGKKDLCKLLNE